jgi:hypothetical protein
LCSLSLSFRNFGVETRNTSLLIKQLYLQLGRGSGVGTGDQGRDGGGGRGINPSKEPAVNVIYPKVTAGWKKLSFLPLASHLSFEN